MMAAVGKRKRDWGDWRDLVQPVRATALAGPEQGKTRIFRPHSRKHIISLRKPVSANLTPMVDSLGPAARAWEAWEAKANPSFEAIDWIVDGLNCVSYPHHKRKRIAAPDPNNPNQITAAQDSSMKSPPYSNGDTPSSPNAHDANKTPYIIHSLASITFNLCAHRHYSTPTRFWQERTTV